MATAASAPPTCVAVAQSANPNSAREKHKSTLFRLGITETVLGSVSCIVCILSIILQYSIWHRYKEQLDSLFTFIASGIWCGVFVIASGGLGISAQKYPNVCVYNANMALSIVAACFAGTQTIISGLAIPFTYSYIKASHVLLTIIGFTCLVICIVHSAYCCAGTCCRKKQTDLPLTYSAVAPQQHYVQLMNGRYMLVQNQPVMAPTHPSNAMTPTVNFVTTPVPGANQGTTVPSAPMSTQQVYPVLQVHSGINPMSPSAVAPVALSAPMPSCDQTPQVENPHFK